MKSFETKQAAREERIRASAEKNAERAAARARDQTLAKLKVKVMSPRQYRAALETLGITVVGAAVYFGISRRQAQRLAGEGPVHRLVEKVVKLLLDGKLKKEDLL